MKTKRRMMRASGPTGSAESKRSAVVVLEVLSGTRTTIDASKALGVTLARYYQLEARALQGVVTALEPARRGKRADPKREVDTLRNDTARLQREVTRLHALLRASQRALGVASPSKPEKSKLGGKRRRRATARALRAVRALRAGQDTSTDAADGTGPKPEAREPAAGA
jgi:hypothetical protein